MTRGKNGISATARKAVSERDQSIAAYQHNIRKLTAEVAALKARLEEQQKAHSKTVQVLKVERDEGLSPTLSVLQKENERLQIKAAQGEHFLKTFRDWHNKMFNRIADHVQTVERLTKLEAIHLTHQIMADEGILGEQEEWIPPDYKQAQKLGPEATLRIQRAQGVRR